MDIAELAALELGKLAVRPPDSRGASLSKAGHYDGTIYVVGLGNMILDNSCIFFVQITMQMRSPALQW